MKRVNTIMGEFTFDRAQRFRRKFQKSNGKDFTFEGETIQHDFAKYVVEFLMENFDLASEDDTPA